MFKEFVKRYLLLVILLFLVIIGSVLWGTNFLNLEDFGLNFMTEILGVLITIYVIDKLIKKERAQYKIPFTIAEYNNAVDIVNDFLKLWTRAYYVSVPFPYPKGYMNFLSPNGLEQVYYYLDVTKTHHNLIKYTWIDELNQRIKYTYEDCDKFLNIYSSVGNPELYESITNFKQSKFFNLQALRSIIPIIDRRDGKKLPVLANYQTVPSPEDYSKINNLIKVLNTMKSDFIEGAANRIKEIHYCKEFGNNERLESCISSKFSNIIVK